MVARPSRPHVALPSMPPRLCPRTSRLCRHKMLTGGPAPSVLCRAITTAVRRLCRGATCLYVAIVARPSHPYAALPDTRPRLCPWGGPPSFALCHPKTPTGGPMYVVFVGVHPCPYIVFVGLQPPPPVAIVARPSHPHVALLGTRPHLCAWGGPPLSPFVNPKCLPAGGARPFFVSPAPHVKPACLQCG
ncbi:hypothetical protein C8R44DRAFT_895804 [Mycena epipterygia]|nr:hypothetical protein C8R44DRAFT_895804 [Mycena epipterygia]